MRSAHDPQWRADLSWYDLQKKDEKGVPGAKTEVDEEDADDADFTAIQATLRSGGKETTKPSKSSAYIEKTAGSLRLAAMELGGSQQRLW